MPENEAAKLTELLLTSKMGHVELAGLGARDSLRLEAGLCLYGNDLDETTTPIEAGLAWTIGKRRRETRDFPGAELILNQLKEKPSKRRVGLLSQGPPARAGVQVTCAQSGEVVGQVTSGCPAPSIKGYNVAMAYVGSKFAKAGTELKLQVRKKDINATVTKMPFVKANYYMSK